MTKRLAKPPAFRRAPGAKLLAAGAAALFALGFVLSACQAEEEDPTAAVAEAFSLEAPDQPLDLQAPTSQFSPPKNDEAWEQAYARATGPVPDTGGGLFDFTQDLGDTFRSALDFKSERYTPGETVDELTVVLRAAKAVKHDKQVVLTEMTITYLQNEAQTKRQKPAENKTAPKEKKANPDKAKPGKDKPEKDKTEKDKAAKEKANKPKAVKTSPENESADNKKSAMDLPFGGRVVISAPRAVIDMATNEGRATGGVTVKVYAKPEAGQSETPLAVLSTDHLNWRSWTEPALGSSELVVHTCGANGEPDPLVNISYLVTQPDGTTATVHIDGYGLIYESGTYDRLNTIYDDDGRSAGLSKIERNRALIHRRVQINTTATTMNALMPFQRAAVAARKKPAAPEPAPSRTVIDCQGPVVFDFAAVPRVKKEVPEATTAEPAALNAILLGRRFEFLNGVHLKKAPAQDVVAPAGVPPDVTEMSCRHLCMQYPPAGQPGASSFPEYAEAIGGVVMHATNAGPLPMVSQAAPQPAAGKPDAAPEPFDCACDRVYYDYVNDNMFLVGTAAKPVELKSARAEAQAQQLDYRLRCETFTMPSNGPKRLVMRASPAAKTPAGGNGEGGGMVNLTNSDTILRWRGPLSREIKHCPVPNAPDLLKEILTLNDDVYIEQPEGGLKMHGARVQLIRSLPDGGPEYLEGEGNVDVTMGDLEARGETFSTDIVGGKNGQPARNLVKVVGSRKRDVKAMLFRGGSAMRADKFTIEMTDDKPNTFRAEGGTVAVFKAPPAPETPAKTPAPALPQDSSALIKSISFQPGGDMLLQCDGDFIQDAANGKVTVEKNVLIRQPGMQLLADTVHIMLDTAPPPPVQTPGKPAAPNAAATPADALFAGDLKSIECVGNVEISTPDQVVQCDRLFHSVPDEVSDLKMDDPENDVRIYLSDGNGGSRFVSVTKSFKMDGKTGDFDLGGMLLMLPFSGNKPVARDKASSPARLTQLPKSGQAGKKGKDGK